MYDNIIDVAVICHLSSVIYDYLISYSHFIGILIIVEYTMVRILDSFFRDHRDELSEENRMDYTANTCTSYVREHNGHCIFSQ
jgi:hypothetical protein